MNKNKVLKVVAGSLAGALLGGALIYYNCIDKETVQKIKVGDTSPNFVVDTYQVVDGQFQTGGEQFDLSKQDKLTVINFWMTWCAPCKAEMPHFNRLQEEYADDVTVLALVTTDQGGTKGYEGLGRWLNANPDANGWEDFSLTFGYYDNSNHVYNNYGLGGSFPITVFVDGDGKIVDLHEASFHEYEDLEDVVRGLIGESDDEGTEEKPVEPEGSEEITQKSWWDKNALGVAFLAVSAAALGSAIVVSAVTTAKDKKKKK